MLRTGIEGLARNFFENSVDRKSSAEIIMGPLTSSPPFDIAVAMKYVTFAKSSCIVAACMN